MKVAETVASRLVANIVIDEAIYLALRHIRAEVQSSEEEEIEITKFEQQPSAPRFVLTLLCSSFGGMDWVCDCKSHCNGKPFQI